MSGMQCICRAQTVSDAATPIYAAARLIFTHCSFQLQKALNSSSDSTM